MKSMDTLAITQQQKIAETTVRFREKIETMDRLAIMQEQTIVEATVRFYISRKD